MKDVIESYNKEVDALPDIHCYGGGGDARNASGLVYENLIKRTCDHLEFVAKKNDYKKSMEVNGYYLDNLQVDWHVYENNVMTKAVESKCYLDACYLKRVVFDFIELEQSPEVPDNVEYAIFAGQNACGDKPFAYYPALFKKLTGKDLTIFIVNPQRKRNSKRAIYKAEHRKDFDLDMGIMNKFVEWIKN